VTCYAKVTRRGRTSLTVEVRVVAQSPSSKARGEPERDVTQAEVVYVQVDAENRPIPLAR
jgi:acyl-CoA hydrolase